MCRMREHPGARHNSRRGGLPPFNNDQQEDSDMAKHMQGLEQRQEALPAIYGEISQRLPTLVHLLPADINIDQFRASLALHFNSIDKLIECTPKSVLSGVIKAATYGMMPGRDCWLLPFRNKGKLEAVFVPDYRGLIRTLERSGKVKRAFAHPVYANDHFVADYLADTFSHQPAMGKQRGTLKFFYACILLKDGTRHVHLMHLEDIEAIKKGAPGHDQGPWATHYEEMAKKTVLKQLCKYVQLTDEVTQLLQEDDERETTDFHGPRGEDAAEDLFGVKPEVVDHTQPVDLTDVRHDATDSDMVARATRDDATEDDDTGSNFNDPSESDTPLASTSKRIFDDFTAACTRARIDWHAYGRYLQERPEHRCGHFTQIPPSIMSGYIDQLTDMVENPELYEWLRDTFGLAEEDG